MGTGLTIACIVIACAKRRQLLDEQILPPILMQGFDEIVVAGDYHDGDGYRYLSIPPLTRSTNDALLKRDAGTLATTADWICYLSDDHTVAPDFVEQFRAYQWNADVLIPARYSQHPKAGRIRIPMGDPDYCGGHGGVFRRWVIQARPWTAMPHDRIWDVLASRVQYQLGARFVCAPQLEIQDMEPEACPWQ